MATNKANGVQIIKPKMDLEEAAKALALLAGIEVLVGFPEDSADRKETEAGSPITNAALGYIHDNGAPEQNIPARPFMGPGIEAVREKLANKLGQMLKAVIVKGGGAAAVEQGYHQVGLMAANSIKRAINEGIPPPLAESTLRSRVRRNSAKKGALRELDRRWDDQAPSTEFAKPLVESAQMRNAVSYAIRATNKRK